MWDANHTSARHPRTARQRFEVRGRTTDPAQGSAARRLRPQAGDGGGLEPHAIPECSIVEEV